jgi:hypothetical protein
VTRILILIALALFVIVALRRALSAGKVDERPSRRPRGPFGPPPARRSESPDQLVCGACGQQFDPEESGWICPRCGK